MWNNFISFNLSLLGQRAPHQQPAVSGMKNDIRYEIFSLLTIRWWHLLYFCCCCIPSHDKIQSQSSQNSLLITVDSWVMSCCSSSAGVKSEREVGHSMFVSLWIQSFAIIIAWHKCRPNLASRYLFINREPTVCDDSWRTFPISTKTEIQDIFSIRLLSWPTVPRSRVLSVSAFQCLTWKPPTINNRPHQMWHQIPEQKKYQVAFLHGK